MQSEEIIKQQRAWLDKLQEISKKPILIKALEGKTPDGANPRLYQWTYYKDVPPLEKPYFTRSILVNEIVLDPDTQIWSDLKEEFDKIILTLQRLKIPYLLAYSGGKGCHLHLFFDMGVTLPDGLFTKARDAHFDVHKAFRQYIFEYIIAQSGASVEKLKIDKPKINWQIFSMGSQVRDFGTLRDNGFCKTFIAEVPATRPDTPLPLVFPDSVPLWTIPAVHHGLIIKRIQDGIERQETYNNEAPTNLTGITDIEKIPCIATIMKGLDTGRYYGASAITLMGKELGYVWDKIEPIVTTYLNKCPGLSQEDINLRRDNCHPLLEATKRFSCKWIRENMKNSCPGQCVVTEKRQGGKYSLEYQKNGNLEVGDFQEIEQRKMKQASLNLTGLCVDNFLIKYISYASTMTDSYVDYHVGNALWLLSVTANRKIKVSFAHETIYPNIWIFIIGDSTIARKTASVAIGYDKIAIPVFGTRGFLPQSSSPESLIEQLSNAPRSSLVRDEAGGFLRELDKNYMQGMKDTLCALYDNRDYHRTIRTGQRKGTQTDFNIQKPFLNLLFATTPDVFKNYSNLLDITSGWLVRFLYFTPDHEKEWRGYRKETIDDINIRNDVRHCLDLIKLRVDNWTDEKEFELSDGAMSFFTEWQRRTETEAMKNRDRNKLRILGRLHTYAVKIALLFALGDNSDSTTITKTHIEIACRVIEDYFLITAGNLLEDISRDETHNLQDKIVGILKTYGKVNIRDILRFTHRPKKEIAEALEALDERGSYELKTTKSPSGKTIFYELNGVKTKVTTVATVTSVTKVANVPYNAGMDATVVTLHKENDIGRRRLERYSCDSSDSCDSCDSCDTRDRTKETDNPVTVLTQSILEAGKEFEQKNGVINSSNIIKFSMWFCEQYHPKWQSNGESGEYTPSAIRGIAAKIFKLTPEPGQGAAV